MLANHSGKQIMVIGAGYAGIIAAVRLAGKTRKQNVQITLVNASEFFVERVRLHQFAANKMIKQRSMVDILRGTGITFQQGFVNGIDTSRREVKIQTGRNTQTLRYDYLVYALGSATEQDSIPGISTYAYTLTPAGALSAAALREKLPALNAAHGRIIVAGGGTTGAESAAEFADKYPNLQITLVTRGKFGAFLGSSVAAYMRRSLEQRRVTIVDQTTVTEIQANEIVMANGAILPFELCLWTGGFSAPALAREAGIAVNEGGQLLTDPFMRSISHPEIYGAGDAAHPLEEPGNVVRMSAFTAVIMGAHVANCLSAVLNGKTPKPLSFAYAGQGIALGHNNAIGFSNYPDDNPHSPYFTGRLGYEFREFFVRLLAALPLLEKRIPGFFIWFGKGRYAAAKRQTEKKLRAMNTETTAVR